VGWSERRKRQWASAFFGLTDEYKIKLHELIFDLSSAQCGGLGYDAVYNMPVHYRMFYVGKLTRDKEKEKEAFEKAKGMHEAASSKVVKGPQVGPRG
jgi:hypothetical protein